MTKNHLNNSISRIENPSASAAPQAGLCPAKDRRILWLALPLALIVGCASDPSRSAWNDQSYTKFSAPVNGPGTRSDQANVAVGQELFNLFLTITNSVCDLSAVADNGVVVLSGDFVAGTDGQSMVDQVWALPGVTRVQDEQGNNLTKTAVAMPVAVR